MFQVETCIMNYWGGYRSGSVVALVDVIQRWIARIGNWKLRRKWARYPEAFAVC